MKLSKTATLIAAVLWGVASGASALTSAPTDPVHGRAPSLTSAAFVYTDVNGNGRVDAGDALKIAETGFNDDDGDAAAASEYKWYRGSLDMGVTGSSYTLTTADLGTVITAGVIPQTDTLITDPYQGVEVAVSSGSPDNDDGSVEVVAATEVDAVEIVIAMSDAPLTGNPIVTEELKAKVTTSAGTSGVASDYNYQWMIEDSAGSNTYSAITGATNETYSPVKGDQKRKLQVDVTKK